MKNMNPQNLILVETIEQKIIVLRGHRVILDADLAHLYGVGTKVLNQAVKRNQNRFPEDFMFQLNAQEKAEVVTIRDHLQKLKFSPVLPYAFTEHGAVMLANVLTSPTAVRVGIQVVRAFIHLRQLVATNENLILKFEILEKKVGEHDADIKVVFAAIRKLLRSPDESDGSPMGFQPPREE
jgi:hypothetical protein